MIDGVLWVQISALIAYVSIIITIILGLLQNELVQIKWFTMTIRKWLHAIAGSCVLFAGIFHIVMLGFTSFDFRKIYSPIEYFDIFVWCAVIGTLCIVWNVLSSYMKKYINWKIWNNTHNLAYVAYILISIHAFGRAGNMWGGLYYYLIGISASIITILFIFRIWKGTKWFV